MPNKDLIFRLLILNRVLLWGSVFRGEGSGNEDNFLNSGCCAGPRFQAGKVPPLSPASVFASTVRQTAEKSNVFFADVDSNTVSGTAAIAGREDGASASSVLFLVLSILQMTMQMVILLEPLMGRATLAGAGHSADGGDAGDFPGALMVRANPAAAAHPAGACIAQPCGGEHSSVPARSSRACGGGHSAVRAGCGAGVFCLRSWGALPEASGALQATKFCAQVRAVAYIPIGWKIVHPSSVTWCWNCAAWTTRSLCKIEYAMFGRDQGVGAGRFEQDQAEIPASCEDELAATSDGI